MAKKLYSAEEIEKKIDSLPREVRSLLYSFEMTSIVTKVGEKHGLHLDQMDALNTEAAQVMLGLTETSEFPEILMEDLGIDQTKAAAIAKDVDEMLFTRVRAALSQPSVVENNPTTPPVTPKVAAPVVPAATNPVAPVTPAVDMHPADLMLTQKTVVTPPLVPTTPTPGTTTPAAKPATQNAIPPKPQEYKADPYREPVN